MGKIKDLTGQKFGRLTALEPTNRKSNNRNVIWKCRCDCKNHTIIYVSSNDLLCGHTQSCGCLRNEMCKKLPQQKSDFKILNKKLNSRNTSGVKGVSWASERQVWDSYIMWKYKKYHLLHSKDINDCIAIRKEAEDAVRDGVFEEWIAAYRGRRCT